jgi:D-3-phosphoglycerate dehydrogenase
LSVPHNSSVVVLTDRAWPDDQIERGIVEGAGFSLVDAATEAVDASLESLIKECQPAAIMTCWSMVSRQDISSARRLKIVARLGIGLDNIAVDVATARGIWVSNVPDYCVEEVSDHALGLILDWTRQIARLDAAVKAGTWDPSSVRLRRLATLTVGLIGYGRIGRRLGEKLKPFGCRMLAHARVRRAAEAGVQFVDLRDLLTQSDIVVLVVPLTDDTRGLMNMQRLAQMRRGALLVNVSRGPLVDNAALTQALHEGWLGGAALDVLDGEPVVPDVLRRQKALTITPHVAFSSDASVAELRRRASHEVVRVLQGEPPIHACNQPLRV